MESITTSQSKMWTESYAVQVQFELNDGEAVATSIPATEHSVMTSWPNEEAAIANMIEKFGDGFFSVVMDSYDYEKVHTILLPLPANTRQHTHTPGAPRQSSPSLSHCTTRTCTTSRARWRLRCMKPPKAALGTEACP